MGCAVISSNCLLQIDGFTLRYCQGAVHSTTICVFSALYVLLQCDLCGINSVPPNTNTAPHLLRGRNEATPPVEHKQHCYDGSCTREFVAFVSTKSGPQDAGCGQICVNLPLRLETSRKNPRQNMMTAPGDHEDSSCYDDDGKLEFDSECALVKTHTDP